MLLRGGGLEALRLVDGEVAGQPHTSPSPLSEVLRTEEIVRVVLRFEQLLAEAGQALRGGLSCAPHSARPRLTVGDFLPVFVKALSGGMNSPAAQEAGSAPRMATVCCFPTGASRRKRTSSSASSEARSFFVHAAEVQLEAPAPSIP